MGISGCKTASPYGDVHSGKLEHLVSLPLMETMPEAVAEPVEGICQEIADHLQSEGLLDSNDPWLFAQGPVIQAHIENNALRSMPPQLE